MLICPPCDNNKQSRIDIWKQTIESFISDPALQMLLTLFDFRPRGGSLEQRLENLREFADLHWDYRRKSGGQERWETSDRDQIVMANAPLIIECARKLGMIDPCTTKRNCDYIMVLGGARSANLNRMQMAQCIQKSLGQKVPVVALTAKRPLGEIEIPHVISYVKDAVAGKTTEYDVISKALEIVFSMEMESEESSRETENKYAAWSIRRYDGGAVVCAPSSEPEKRRANTVDTLRFFLQRFSVMPGSVLHFATNPIYINYQTAALMPIAFEYNLELLFSGTGSAAKNRSPVVSNYLQEVKSSIDAICRSIGI